MKYPVGTPVLHRGFNVIGKVVAYEETPADTIVLDTGDKFLFNEEEIIEIPAMHYTVFSMVRDTFKDVSRSVMVAMHQVPGMTAQIAISFIQCALAELQRNVGRQ